MSAPTPPVSTASRRRALGQGALLVLLIVLAYLPVFRSGFVWDDDSFLTRNKLIAASDGLRRLWFTTEAADYWPVTSTTLWFEWRLWGLHPLGYHLTNLMLHVGESLLLWVILRRLKVPGAWLAAAFFGLHPVNVESVAWITQRKNLMAMLFYLASIWFYLKADFRTEPAKARRLPLRSGSRQAFVSPWYWLSLGGFILAMLSKGSVAILPVILLGLILWHRRLEVRDAVRLLPFFLVALVLGLVNVWFATHGSAVTIREAGAVERLLGAAAAVWFYLSKAVLPIKLLFVYPPWDIRTSNPLWWLPLAGALLLTLALWRWSRARTPPGGGRRWGRPALFAWGYFCVALVPVMGFQDVYFMKYSLVADHYQHLAIIGVVTLVAAGWGPPSPAARGLRRASKRIAAAAAIGLLGALTYRQCRLYRDSETLFRATLEHNPNSWVLRYNLGNVLFAEGKAPEAINQLERALQLEPDSGDTYLALANVRQSLGLREEAIDGYEKALRLQPYLAEAHNNLGNALREAGREDEAFLHYQEALRLRPDYPEAHCNLGVVLAHRGLRAEAIAQYEAALRAKPDYPEAHDDLGNSLRADGRVAEAIPHYIEALRLKPDFPEAHNNWGVALAQTGRLPEAIGQFAQAIRLKPDYAEAHGNLGLALQLSGRAAEADAEFKTAERLGASR